MKLTELHDEPLLISILRGIMKRDEQVYMGLGKLKYFLRSIKWRHPSEHSVPGTRTVWQLDFSQWPGSLVTSRTITWDSESKWALHKEESGSGLLTGWRMGTLE